MNSVNLKLNENSTREAGVADIGSGCANGKKRAEKGVGIENTHKVNNSPHTYSKYTAVKCFSEKVTPTGRIRHSITVFITSIKNKIALPWARQQEIATALIGVISINEINHCLKTLTASEHFTLSNTWVGYKYNVAKKTEIMSIYAEPHESEENTVLALYREIYNACSNIEYARWQTLDTLALAQQVSPFSVSNTGYDEQLQPSGHVCSDEHPVNLQQSAILFDDIQECSQIADFFSGARKTVATATPPKKIFVSVMLAKLRLFWCQNSPGNLTRQDIQRTLAPYSALCDQGSYVIKALSL